MCVYIKFLQLCNAIIEGFFSGLIGSMGVAISVFLYKQALILRDKERIHNWIKESGSNPDPREWRSTRSIANNFNLPEDLVRYI